MVIGEDYANWARLEDKNRRGYEVNVVTIWILQQTNQKYLAQVHDITLPFDLKTSRPTTTMVARWSVVNPSICHLIQIGLSKSASYTVALPRMYVQEQAVNKKKSHLLLSDPARCAPLHGRSRPPASGSRSYI